MSKAAAKTSGISTARELDALLSRLARLARTDENEVIFFGQLLESVTLSIGAEGAALWVRVPGQFLAPQHRFQIENVYNQSLYTVSSVESRRLLDVLESNEPAVLAPNPDAGLQCATLACPIRTRGRETGVLVVYLAATTPTATQTRLLELVDTFADIATDFDVQQQISTAAEELRFARQLEAFVRQIHKPWTLDEVAYEVVNEGRRLIHCDRLTVLCRRKGGWRILAVSGIERVCRRAVEAKRLESLVKAVMASGQPLIYQGTNTALAPQVEVALGEFLDGAATRELVIAPAITLPGEPTSGSRQPQVAIVAEQFRGTLPSSWMPRIEFVGEHASLALGRALALARLPFAARWVRTSGWSISSILPRVGPLALVLALLVVGACLLTFVQTSFRVTSYGRLVPADRRWVFAPADAVVEQVNLKHGQPVKENDILVTLTSTDLDLDIKRVEGQVRTSLKELESLTTAKLQQDGWSKSSNLEATELSARHLATNEHVNNLRRQLRLLRDKRLALAVKSPIAGNVLNWEPSVNLKRRPVRRGQSLVEVGRLDGDWIVELDIPDRSFGHVLQQMRQAPGPLPVSFILMGNPGQSHQGRMVRVSEVTQQRPQEAGAHVLATVEFDKQLLTDLRNGAVVVAKIDCGTRSLGFTWFHEVWEEIQRRLL